MDKDGVLDIWDGMEFVRIETTFSSRWRRHFFSLLVTAKEVPKLQRHESLSLRWSRWMGLSGDGDGDASGREDFLTDRAEFWIPKTT